jgi:TolA-binding protein
MNPKPCRAAGAAAFFALLLHALPAHAQIESREGIALENEILELRQQVQTTQQQLQGLQQLGSQASAPQLPPPVPQGGGDQTAVAPNDMVAQLVVRVSALEEQMRTLQGHLDDLTNTEKRDHDDLAKQIGDLAFKLNGGAAPSATQPDPPAAPSGVEGVPDDLSPPPEPAPKPAAPEHRTAEQTLKLGSAALARRDYAAAAAAAQEVLAAGRGPRTPDAQFLLARAQAGKHDYKAAAAAYYAVYKSAPKSPRGAESLIGVANAFLGMGDKTHACQAAAKFGAEFPRPDAGLRGQATSVRKRAGC